jgi:hypothetical protein
MRFPSISCITTAEPLDRLGRQCQRENMKSLSTRGTAHREEVLNVVLAQILCDLEIVADPERILESLAKRKLPDVLVEFAGLRIILEGKIGDSTAAKKEALRQARERVEGGLAHIGLAIVYPCHLRHADFSELKSGLMASKIEVAVVSESTEKQHELFPDLTRKPPESSYSPFTCEGLAELLRQAFDHLVKEDVVAEAVNILEHGVESFFTVMARSLTLVKRVAKSLDIPLPTRAQQSKFIAGVSRITALILLNAIIFQEILANHNSEVRTLRQTLKSENPLEDFARHWDRIINDIDYYPIFNMAIKVIECLPTEAALIGALEQLVDAGRKVIRLRAALRHDLMGRIYHRWLLEAKYLGAYYTKISSAILLLKLALRPQGWKHERQTIEEIEVLKIADLACGTGTLLMAAANVLTDNFIRASNASGDKPDLQRLQEALGEKVLYGYDVVGSALHITASTLAMRSPGTILNNMNLFWLPLGGKVDSLGSIEYLKAPRVELNLDLFSAPIQVTPDGEKNLASIPELDLCVMNPPFVRSVVGNLLFGSLPQEDRPRLQRKLKKIMAGLPANITAGLGSVFVVLGDQYLKPGGRIALVLPKALLSGVAWADTRKLLSDKYEVEYIVASHEPGKWNFSESTNLSEVLLVAKKRDPDSENEDKKSVAVNLWHFPETTFEALAVSSEILGGHAPDLETGQGAQPLLIGERKIGEVISIPWSEFKNEQDWLLPCGFAQVDLARVLLRLKRGQLRLPGQAKQSVIPLTRLDSLGSLGPDQRDVVDGFDVSTSPTSYFALWGHDSSQIRTLEIKPNKWLYPLPSARKGRNLRKTEDLWPKSSRIMLPARLRFNANSCVAVRLNQKALGISWWPLSLKSALQSPQMEKSLLLWFNSTLGLLLLIGFRVEQQGPWVNLKKPSLHSMPVLNLRKVQKEQFRQLVLVYDEVCNEQLQPLPFMCDDPVRQRIDSAVERVLNLPDLTVLREMLAREPNISLNPL